MLSLRETQKRFADGILGGTDINNLIVTGLLKPEQRMAIYRNHYKASLREVLVLTFPVVVRLVGEGFFNGMADSFTPANAPSRPCLAEYGGNFPDFIAGFEPVKHLPYLADVALFEWLIAEAAHTPNYQGMAFYSRYPVSRIWKTNQPGYKDNDIVNLDEGGGWFVVDKTNDIVSWQMLDLPPDSFMQRQEETT